MRMFSILVILLGLTISTAAAYAQSPEAAPPAPAAESPAPAAATPEAQAVEKAHEIAKKVDHDPRAQEASAGILKQIYVLAEKLSFPMFHWAAFALMVSGVASFALQLTLGKLFVLARMSISPSEILSDIQGLAISIVGLVLTTQAAAENSTFTQSPAAVLSSTAAGVVVGYVFYRWGKAQELAAADGRKVAPKVQAPAKS